MYNDEFDLKKGLIFGAGFLAVNIVVAFLLHNFFTVMTILMAIFYTVSGDWLKKRYDISFLQISLVQTCGNVLLIPIAFLSVDTSTLLTWSVLFLPGWLLSIGIKAFRDKDMKRRDIFFSMAFLVLNYLLFTDRVRWVILAAIYILFALKMKTETSWSMYYICFIQFGHIFAVIANVAALIIGYNQLFNQYDFIGILAMSLGVVYLIIVPVIVAVSAVITVVIRSIIKSRTNEPQDYIGKGGGSDV